MFSFRHVARQAVTFQTSDQEKLEGFRSRLQYLIRGVQGYIKLISFLPRLAASKLEDLYSHVAMASRHPAQSAVWRVWDKVAKGDVWSASVIFNFTTCAMPVLADWIRQNCSLPSIIHKLVSARSVIMLLANNIMIASITRPQVSTRLPQAGVPHHHPRQGACHPDLNGGQTFFHSTRVCPGYGGKR